MTGVTLAPAVTYSLVTYVKADQLFGLGRQQINKDENIALNQEEVKQSDVDESFMFEMQLHRNNNTHDFPIIYNKTEFLIVDDKPNDHFFWF